MLDPKDSRIERSFALGRCEGPTNCVTSSRRCWRRRRLFRSPARRAGRATFGLEASPKCRKRRSREAWIRRNRRGLSQVDKSGQESLLQREKRLSVAELGGVLPKWTQKD